MDLGDRAENFFAGPANCSQSVLAVLTEAQGEDVEQALKVSSAFGGGMRHGGACGAVTGALMAIGLAHGSGRANGADRENVYPRVVQFLEEFRAEFGSLECKSLLGVDITTPEGQAEALEKEFATKVCPRFVNGATTLVSKFVNLT